eukprot:tig00020816_g14197.t1
MADFAKLWTGRHEVVQKFFESTRDAESSRPVEIQSAIRIQRLWRGYRVRKRLWMMNWRAMQIQRLFRGHLGRQRFAVMYKQRLLEERMQYFNQAATQFQKIFRGYYCRKYIHNYYARKSYLTTIVAKNAEVMNTLHMENLRQARYEEEEKQRKLAQEFHNTVSSLHHLVGTRTVPSALKSAYAFGRPIEEHLKDAAKVSISKSQKKDGSFKPSPIPQGTLSTGSVKPPIGTQRNPSPSKRNKLSVQAQSEYGIAVESMRSEARYSKLRMVGGEIRTGKASIIGKYVPSVTNGAPYGPGFVFRQEDRTKRVAKAPYYLAYGSGKVFEDSLPVSEKQP